MRLILLFLTVVFQSIQDAAAHQGAPFYIPQVPNPQLMNIDGLDDDWKWLDPTFAVTRDELISWWGISENRGFFMPEDDLNVTYYVAWSAPPDNRLYVFARVEDDIYRAAEGGNKFMWWRDDTLQLTVDADHSGGLLGRDEEAFLGNGQRYNLVPYQEGCSIGGDSLDWGCNQEWASAASTLYPSDAGNLDGPVTYTYEIAFTLWDVYSATGHADSEQHQMDSHQVLHLNVRFSDADESHTGEQDLVGMVGGHHEGDVNADLLMDIITLPTAAEADWSWLNDIPKELGIPRATESDYEEQVRSLQEIIRKSTDEKTRVDVEFRIAETYQLAGNTRLAVQQYRNIASNYKFGDYRNIPDRIVYLVGAKHNSEFIANLITGNIASLLQNDLSINIRRQIDTRIAGILASAGDMDGAIQEYQRILRDYELSPIAKAQYHRSLASCFETKKDYEAAVAEYRKTLEFNAEELRSLERENDIYHIARLEEKLEWDQIGILDESLSIMKRFPHQQAILTLLEDQGKNLEAINAIASFLETTTDPGEIAHFRYRIGLNFRYLADYEAAKAHFVTLCQEYEDVKYVWTWGQYQLAAIDMLQGSHSSALKRFENISSHVDGDDRELIISLEFGKAQASLGLEMYTEARKILRQLVGRYPDKKILRDAYQLLGNHGIYKLEDE